MSHFLGSLSNQHFLKIVIVYYLIRDHCGVNAFHIATRNIEMLADIEICVIFLVSTS